MHFPLKYFIQYTTPASVNKTIRKGMNKSNTKSKPFSLMTNIALKSFFFLQLPYSLPYNLFSLSHHDCHFHAICKRACISKKILFLRRAITRCCCLTFITCFEENKMNLNEIRTCYCAFENLLGVTEPILTCNHF